MAFAACHQKPRTAWLSPNFAKDNTSLLVIMVHKTCPPAGKWTWKTSKADLLEAPARFARSRPTEAIAFVSESEVKDKDMNT